MGDPRDLERMLTELRDLACRGDLEALRARLHEVARDAEAAGDTALAAAALIEAGRFAADPEGDEARGFLDRATVLALSAEEPALEARALLELATRDFAAGRKDTAIERAARAEALAEAAGDPVAHAVALLHLSWLFRETGRLADADEAARMALQQAQTSGQVLLQSQALASMAHAHAALGRTEEAAALAQAAARLAGEVEGRPTNPGPA